MHFVWCEVFCVYHTKVSLVYSKMKQRNIGECFVHMLRCHRRRCDTIETASNYIDSVRFAIQNLTQVQCFPLCLRLSLKTRSRSGNLRVCRFVSNLSLAFLHCALCMMFRYILFTISSIENLNKSQVSVAFSDGKVCANELSSRLQHLADVRVCVCVYSLFSFMHLIAFVGWDIYYLSCKYCWQWCCRCRCSAYNKSHYFIQLHRVHFVYICEIYCVTFIRSALLRLSDWIIRVLCISCIDNTICVSLYRVSVCAKVFIVLVCLSLCHIECVICVL